MNNTSLYKIKNALIVLIKKPSRLATLIAPPFAVLAVMFTVFALNGMYPFGDKTLAWCDMRQQVVPLLLDFKDILAGKGDFFLSMQNASGMNFYGVFLFFISSPFTFLVAFVEKADMMVFMNILTVLKMMMCAITANAYFRHCHKKLSVYYSAIFAVMYAFSGYAMLFYQNTVWLDVMYFFPLLLISFNALIQKRKTAGFIFCLVGMLVLNYYLSYMVVVFTVLFFGIYLIFNRKSVKGTVAHLFVIGCVIAALISAVVWLPSFAQYLSSARGANIVQGLLDSRLFTYLHTNLPLIFCTAFSFAAIIVFFARRKTKTSRMYAVLMFLMLLPVVFEPINKMWHTGDYMSFPVRYGYITTFIMLVYAAIKLEKLTPDDYAQKTSKRCLIPICCAAVAYSVFSVVYYYNLEPDLDNYTSTLWGNSTSLVLLLVVFCGFAGIYTLTLGMGVIKKLRFSAVCILLAAVTLSECFFSANVYVATAAYVPAKYNGAIVLEDKIPEDDDFFRVKMSQSQNKYFDANLLGGLGYNAISHYTSLTSEDYMFAMKRLGYSSYWMEVTGNGGTLLTDAVMSVKYRIQKFSAKQPAVYRDKNYSVYESEHYLPLGIITDSDLSQQSELPSADRTQIQEHVAKLLLDSQEQLFTEYKPTDEKNIAFTENDGYYYFAPVDDKKTATLKYTIYIEGKQTIYFDCFDLVTRKLKEHINDTFAIYADGIRVNLSYPNEDTNGLLEIGTYENETLTLVVDLNKESYCSSYGVYGLSHEKLNRLIQNAETAGLEVNGNKITGAVENAKTGQYLFLSVPYDKGFDAYVNGKKTEIYKALGGFMALKLSEGENDIELVFIPQGFKTGLILTIAGTALAVLWALFKKRLQPVLEKLEKVCRAGVYALFFAVIAAIYIVPILLCVAGMII